MCKIIHFNCNVMQLVATISLGLLYFLLPRDKRRDYFIQHCLLPQPPLFELVAAASLLLFSVTIIMTLLVTMIMYRSNALTVAKDLSLLTISPSSSLTIALISLVISSMLGTYNAKAISSTSHSSIRDRNISFVHFCANYHVIINSSTNHRPPDACSRFSQPKVNNGLCIICCVESRSSIGDGDTLLIDYFQFISHFRNARTLCALAKDTYIGQR